MTTPLKFRNITASPEDPVQTWPFEGVLAAVERGTLPDWRRLARAIRADPWGTSSPASAGSRPGFLVLTALLNSSREWSSGPARWLPTPSAPRWPLRSAAW